MREDPDPPKTMLALGTREVFDEDPETAKLPAGVSLSPIVNGIAGVGVSSLVLVSVISDIVGRSLTPVTVRSNESLTDPPFPSVTVTVMVAVPIWLEAGVIVTVRDPPLPPKTMLLFGTSVRFEEVPETPSEPSAVSTSLIVKGIALVGVSSLVLLFVISDIVGKSLTEFTVSWNVSRLESVSPSVTVIVIVAEPNWFAAGVTVTVRSAPTPPKVIFAFGTSVRLDDEPETTKSPTGVSASPT